ncbi:MAG: EAL domain-containing protein [Hyphomicrobiales bacterium]|nr:EAL domain-containing protein [Hyphomicrobiales bacterium]
MSLPPPAFSEENIKKPIAYVLDDDGAISALVARMLGTLGYVAFPFSDPSIFLTRLKSVDAYERPGTIVLDLALGRTDAVVVLDQLKALSYRGWVMLISGHDQRTLLEVQKMGTTRGLAMLPWLKKPFRLDELKANVSARASRAPRSADTSTPVLSAMSLERAISSNALDVCYRPVFDLESMTVCAAQATLYAHDPSIGLVPLTSASLAPSSALQHPLARYLLRQVMKDWKTLFCDLKTPLKLIVSVPLTVIASATFFPLIRELLPAQARWPSLIMDAVDCNTFSADRSINEISALLRLYQIGLMASDIGGIHASIVTSEKASFVGCKLSSQLLADCVADERRKAWLCSTIELVHQSGLFVCAADVTSRDQLQALVGVECDMAQGDYLGKPVSSSAFVTSHFGQEQSSLMIGADDPAASDPFAWPVASGPGQAA